MKKGVFTQLMKLEKSTRQLAKWIKTGKYKSLSLKKRQQLVRRIEKMQRNLSLFANSRRVRRAFATAGVVLGLAINPMNAQTFEFKTPVTSSPFGLAATGSVAFPQFGDLDNDGDLDVLVGEYDATNGSSFKYYINNGTSAAPSFGAAQTNPFGLTPSSGYYFIAPTIVDIDNDGDLDVFISSYYGIEYYQNTGTATAPAFAAPVSNPFGLASSYNTSIDFADMDGDGDYDVILGDYYNGGEIQYYQNTGTATAPVFTTLQSNPFGLTSVYDFAIVSIVDLDNDGDFDLMATEAYGVFQYFENTGTTMAPMFAAPVTGAFGANPISGTYILTHDFADIDNDGDMDMLTSAYSNYAAIFGYYENNAIPVSADVTVTTVKNVDYTFAATDFAFTDADNAAATDIMISTLPVKGTLNLGGAPVAANDIIPISVITSLTFSPVADSIGTPYDSFGFQVSDGYSLSDTQMVTVQVEAPVSTNGVLANAGFSIAPNPVNSFLNVDLQLAEPIEQAEIIIMDYTGKAVHVETLDNTGQLRINQQVAVNHLPNGIYILKIATDNGQLVKRFVKQ